MKKVLLLLLMGVLAMSLCACGAPADSGSDETATEAQEAATGEAEQAEAEPAVNTDSAYAVELKDAHRISNYEGVDTLLVVYSFTNNSEDTTSAAVALYIQAFQDGVELESGYATSGDLPEDISGLYDNDWKDIRPGTTLDCYACFELDSESEVEVEANEFLGELLDSKTYTVAQ